MEERLIMGFHKAKVNQVYGKETVNQLTNPNLTLTTLETLLKNYVEKALKC